MNPSGGHDPTRTCQVFNRSPHCFSRFFRVRVRVAGRTAPVSSEARRSVGRLHFLGTVDSDGLPFTLLEHKWVIYVGLYGRVHCPCPWAESTQATFGLPFCPFLTRFCPQLAQLGPGLRPDCAPRSKTKIGCIWGWTDRITIPRARFQTPALAVSTPGSES